MIFDVGQADAILLLAPNGDAVLVDSGKTRAHGDMLAAYLGDARANGVRELGTVRVAYITHYDWDHFGGLRWLIGNGIAVAKVLDRGPDSGRGVRYLRYVNAIGDPNDNGVQDEGETGFVRKTIRYGHEEELGADGLVKILRVAVGGDTSGTGHDVDLKLREDNSGSIALVVRLGEFDLYTAGDQTSDDWKRYPDAEESVLDARAIPGGNDIDVLKVSHHGSDRSTGGRLARELRREVSVISTALGGDGLPKRVVLKVLEENGSMVLITGPGRDEETGRYTDSPETAYDDDYSPSPEAVVDDVGDVTILVSDTGERYSVYAGMRQAPLTFSARDADNRRGAPRDRSSGGRRN